MLFRTLFRPRRWWLLAVPFFFYLTREVCLDGAYPIASPKSVMDYEASSSPQGATAYRVFEIPTPITPNAYLVVRFLANACLLVGGLSVAKELYLPDIKS